MQKTSKEIYDKKYRLKDHTGAFLDKDLAASQVRVATALSRTEPEKYEEFLWAIRNGAIPAGRIFSNAGSSDHKSAVSLINCTVSDTIHDSIVGIFGKLDESAKTLAAGCGIGYEFSTLRPKGAYVKGAGASTSGPIPFMDVYDKMCFTISSAGGRRGAQMGTFDISHPDIYDFIKAKREDGRLRQFNLSCLITKEFVNAVKNDDDWDLVFDGVVYNTVKAKHLWDTIMDSTYDFAEPGFLLIDEINDKNNLWWEENIRATNPCLHPDSLVETIHGRVKIKDIKEPTMVYSMDNDGKLCVAKATASWISKKAARTIKIKVQVGEELTCTPDHLIFVKDKGWVKAEDLKIKDVIIGLCREGTDAWVKLTSQVNSLIYSVCAIEEGETSDVYDLSVEGTHNFIANFMVVHNCGEQPLPPYSACLLGSINLTMFVNNPFTEKADFDYEKYKKVIRIFTRMLDNVCEDSGLPLQQQRDELARKRRHGMGYLGLGSALTMLRLKYGSQDAVNFTADITKVLARESYLEGIALAREKGVAPIMDETVTLDEVMVNRINELHPDQQINAGMQMPGSYLFAYGSKYLKNLLSDWELELLADVGCRFTHATSIAPTGTISLALANNASGGIEPSFSHSYFRNVIMEGQKTKEQMEVMSYELLKYRELIDPNCKVEDLPDYFVTADSVTPKEHVDMQAAAQEFIDSSISKTCNVATDYDKDEFKELYMYAYDKGLKGLTTFRFNPEAFSGVLVNQKDLDNTTIKFALEDGSEVVCKGSDTVSYDGSEHNASNLYDSIKEGTYGKY